MRSLERRRLPICLQRSFCDNNGYVNWTSGNTMEALALDHKGELVWHKDDLANYIHEHGSGASPIVADGIMIVRAEFETGRDGQALGTPEQMDWKSCILGLDAATSAQKWKLEVPNSINPFSTPLCAASQAAPTNSSWPIPPAASWGWIPSKVRTTGSIG